VAGSASATSRADSTSATCAGAAGAEPQEPAVGGQGGLRHDRGRTTATGQRRRFGQGREGAKIVGLLLSVAEPDEETSALAIRDIEGGAVVERRPVPAGRFGGRELPGRVIAGHYRPAASFGEHPAQVVLLRDLSREVDRGRAGPLRQYLGGLRVQAAPPPAREPAVHGAGDQDVHEPQRRDPRPDLSQQPGCLGHVEGVHRVAVGDHGHVDHRAHRELRAQHSGRREHLHHLAPERADAAP
jgi:hypothetical protein